MLTEPVPVLELQVRQVRRVLRARLEPALVREPARVLALVPQPVRAPRPGPRAECSGCTRSGAR